MKHLIQSQDSNNIVFGLVRNRNTSLPGLLQLVETKTNVHILEADITDYASLEVSTSWSGDNIFVCGVPTMS